MSIPAISAPPDPKIRSLFNVTPETLIRENERYLDLAETVYGFRQRLLTGDLPPESRAAMLYALHADEEEMGRIGRQFLEHMNSAYAGASADARAAQGPSR